LLVVEIGGNIKPQAHLVPGWDKARIISLDIDPEMHPDIVADAAAMPEDLYGTLDGVFASHVLEHFRYWQTKNVLLGWVECLKPGGELHILVPSWEWAAREVLSDRPSPALFGHSFAGQVNQWDVHLCMFTMRYLRKLFAECGLSVATAKTLPYQLHVNGQLYEAENHYIMGRKGEPVLRKE
jgi:predicted SAM-dependent methyltransferase